MKKFGDNIKALRREKRLTQTELGKIFNVSHAAIYGWETDKQEPSLEMLVRIADYFNVSVDFLLGRTDY